MKVSPKIKAAFKAMDRADHVPRYARRFTDVLVTPLVGRNRFHDAIDLAFSFRPDNAGIE